MGTILEEIRFLQEDDSQTPERDGERPPLSPQPSSTVTVEPEEGVSQPQNIILPSEAYFQHEASSVHSRPPKTNKCTTCCIGCFGTRQLISKVTTDREAYIRTTLVELVVYLIYLTVFCFIVFGSISPIVYYYTRVLSDLFLDTPFKDEAKTTFRTSSDLKDFWKFAETAMLNGLYWEEWYDDPTIRKPVLPIDQGILYENRIVGLPRLRQIRVKAVDCAVDHLVRHVGGRCYPHYERKYEATENYHFTLTGPEYEYHTEESLKSRYYWGKLATYSGAGAYQHLHEKKDPTLNIIKTLKQNIWIRRQTRVIFLEFTVYNSNINMFCVVKLAWEFSVTGGLVTSWSIQAVRLYRYVSAFDFVIFGFEICFMIFTLYYTLQEFMEICKLGLYEYLTDAWSYLDILILSLSYGCIGFGIYRYILIKEKINPLIKTKNAFADFDFLAFCEIQLWNATAICLFFAWVKIFKYISFNATMSQLSITLSRCAKDIAGFAILFFIVFIAFAQLGYLLFGSQVEGYNSVYNAMFTLLRLILGDFNLAQIETANRVLGPIYFLSYVFFVFFVLLNMFLAIINDTYSEVKTEIQSKRSEFQLTDYIKQKLRCIGAAVSRKTLVNDRPLLREGVEDDGKITPDELKRHLMRANFSATEVDLFLERYELNEDHALDHEETETVIAQLQRGAPISADMQGRRGSNRSRKSSQKDSLGLPKNEIEELDQRISTLEASLTGLLVKMETIISKITQTDEIVMVNSNS